MDLALGYKFNFPLNSQEIQNIYPWLQVEQLQIQKLLTVKLTAIGL
jgi:hypothetical protein